MRGGACASPIFHLRALLRALNREIRRPLLQHQGAPVPLAIGEGRTHRPAMRLLLTLIVWVSAAFTIDTSGETPRESRTWDFGEAP
jgi:hypothetical protein